ncbi:MAG: Oxidoreductase [Labilithrix sp.]|nr:Oxidoreductase [Labilithrix sp.]
MTNEKPVLIVGATGTVGDAAARAAVDAGARVRALVRSASSASKLAAGVEPLTGDLRDEASLRRAADGVRAVLYVSPHEADEEELADRVIRVCEAAQTRLVFVGVHVDGGTRVARALRRWIFGRVLPHYAPKLRLSERVRTSGARPIVLIPTNFFQNDELVLDDIEAGVYPIGFEKPVNRVDVRDVGEAAARALTDDALASGAYPVVGGESLSSAACAATWSEVLGRTIRYDSDESRFRAALARSVTGRKHDDFVASFGALRRFEVPTNPKELAATTALLGRAPTSYRAYVEHVAARALRGEHRAPRGGAAGEEAATLP